MIERCLGAIRLSLLTDATTSPERQAEHIKATTAQRGGKLVGMAEDLDVSASKTPPMKRPDLGPWFTERKDEWDTLIVWRLDRLVRKVGDLAELIKWCEDNNKNIVSATEPFDLSTPLGKALVYLVAVFAEMEASAIKERVTGAQKALRETGRWGGGGHIFGAQPVPNPNGKGWVLEIDPEPHAVLMELIDRVIAGESMHGVMKDFNARKLPSPRDQQRAARGKATRGTEWSVSNMRNLLRSQALLGVTTHQGKVVRDGDGMPIKKAPELIPRAKFNKLQQALDRRTFKAPRSEDTSPLLNIAFCGECSSPLYRHVTRRGEISYTYYKCPNKNLRGTCEAKNVRADELEAAVTDALLDRIGTAEVFEKVEVAGYDHTGELLEVEQALSDLRDDRAAGLFKGDQGTAEFRQIYTRLEARREKLAEMPVQPARSEYVSTGRTWSEVWDSAEGADRRKLLLDAGITAVVTNAGFLTIELSVPSDVLARVQGDRTHEGKSNGFR